MDEFAPQGFWETARRMAEYGILMAGISVVGATVIAGVIWAVQTVTSSL